MRVWVFFMGKKKRVIGSDRSAVLVIDVQNYFFARRSSAFIEETARILQRINRLIASARANGWPVIYTVHRAPKTSGNLMAVQWDHLPSKAESKPFAGLKRRAGEAVIEKEHYSAFMGTRLRELLEELGVGRLILCGVMTHLCVDTTARHGFMLGFRPVIVRDACCSNLANLHAAALACLAHGFAEVSTVAKIVRSVKCTT